MGSPSAAFVTAAHHYITRALPLDVEPASAALAAVSCAPALHNAADGAVAQLLRTMEAARTALPPVPLLPLPVAPALAAAAASAVTHHRQQQHRHPSMAFARAEVDEDTGDDVGAAAQDLVSAVKAVDAALRQAGGRMEPSAAKLLRKCAARIEHLCQSQRS